MVIEPDLAFVGLQTLHIHTFTEIHSVLLLGSALSVTTMSLCAVRPSVVLRVLISIRMICGRSFTERDRRIVEVRALVLRLHGKVWVVISQ